MAGTRDKQHLEKLIQAWNKANEGNLPPKAYKGLIISYAPADWRLDHPTDFPEHCEREKAGDHRIYDMSDYLKCALPASITKMLLTQEVSLEDIEAFITYLLQEKDKRMHLTLPVSSE